VNIRFLRRLASKNYSEEAKKPYENRRFKSTRIGVGSYGREKRPKLDMSRRVPLAFIIYVKGLSSSSTLCRLESTYISCASKVIAKWIRQNNHFTLQ
jgi:hypothetical protein